MKLPWMAERIQLRAISSLRPRAGNARVQSAKHARPSPPLKKLQRATVASGQIVARSARLRFSRA